ncbi:hypothetical protein BD780_000516 [Clostridium tetanomorphum]|uniref:Transcobalamin-like C-terminal domain-containing protein n=1 Tax=Clostridium tetanomorphum TaxID=1553 RepID=A0A923J074_CLOTT|nr:DUF4430 domain-containing protein [Clostridium tetanomorphum]KAJ50357.1 membrane protein [Clostridium tetanomorphum DSM 665]MBC2397752.1 hypothetical protein [Clostridium tetanomorphum]MBP1866029.1 hypothetical protein [Clostridium tetanomorphum]NRS83291.1 hypothetical protein [Clostridium tetanomorphum]NRZ96495.1 hypothetical protein [Clostridium tetanomorphum]
MKILKKSIPVIILFLICFFTIGCGGKKTSDSTSNNSSTVISIDKDNTKNNNGQSSEKEEKAQQLSSKELKGKEENIKDNLKTEKNKINTSTNLSNGINKNLSNPSQSNEKKHSIEKSKIQKQSSNTADKNTFTLIIAKELKGYTGKDSEILVKKQIHIEGNKSAMTYLRENSQIRDKGGFIYEINGIHNLYPIPASKKTPEQKKLKIMGIDWFIYLNGKKTSTGANDVYPKPGDELLLDIHEWDRRELAKDAY